MSRVRREKSARNLASTNADLLTSRLRLVGVVLLCAKVALVPLAFDQGADKAFILPKALLSHALSYLLVGVIFALVIQFGRRSITWSWLHVPVLAFLAASVAATAVAADVRLALFGTHERMLGLGTIADWVVFYFAVAFLLRTPRDAAAVITSTVVSSIAVVAYEFVQFADRDPLRWVPSGASRPFSTLGNPTMLSQYLTTLAMGILALGTVTSALDRRLRIGLVLWSAVLLVGAATTGTRSSLLGVAAGSVILVALVWALHPSRWARAISLGTAVAATLALTALVAFTPLGARVAALVETATAELDDDALTRVEPSTESRLAHYRIGVEMFLERPILGYGPDNFPVGVAEHRSESEPPEVRLSLATSAHSWILYVATGSGLIGLACFIAIALTAMAMTLRHGFHPIGLAGAVALAAFLGTGLTTVTEIDTDWLFWASAGAIAAVTGREVPSRLPSRRPTSRTKHATAQATSTTRSAATAACIALALVLAAASVGAYQASRLGREASAARLASSPRAVDLGVAATKADPGRSAYWHYLGLAYVSGKRWPEAIAALEESVRLAPYDVRPMGDLARAQLVLAGAGDDKARRAALAVADRVVQTDPNSPHAQLTRAVVKQVTGDPNEANRAVDRALFLDPDSINIQLWTTATQIKIAQARASEAISIARQGLAIHGRFRSSADLRYELARALVLDNQPLEALKELDIALGMQPSEAAERLRTQIRAGLSR
ncbi:MAG: O-antigen ligase family protein [Chloroflexota bacterium]